MDSRSQVQTRGRQPSRQPVTRSASSSGFTLIELSIVLVIIGIIISTVAALAPRFLESAQRQENQALLERAEGALIDFAARNARLPCPSAEGEGQEGTCDNDSGYLPFETIGLTDGNDRYGDHLRYGAYRDAGERADLTGQDLEFRNLGEFCLALRNAIEAPNQDALHFTQAGDTDAYEGSLALAVASSGESGVWRGSNSPVDGAAFEHPNTSPADVDDYDDLVRLLLLPQLSSELGCRSAVRDARLEFATSALPDGEDGKVYDLEPRIEVDGGLLDEENDEGYRWCVEERTSGIDNYLDFNAVLNGSPESLAIANPDNDGCRGTDIGDSEWAEGDFLQIDGEDPLDRDDISSLSFRVFVRDQAGGAGHTGREQQSRRTFTITVQSTNNSPPGGNNGNGGNGNNGGAPNGGNPNE